MTVHSRSECHEHDSVKTFLAPRIATGWRSRGIALQCPAAHAHNFAVQNYGALAQLGERLICIQEVSGSIPLSSTRKHLVIKTVNKNNLYQYLYPNIKSYYLMFKIKIWSQHR